MVRLCKVSHLDLGKGNGHELLWIQELTQGCGEVGLHSGGEGAAEVGDIPQALGPDVDDIGTALRHCRARGGRGDGRRD